MRCCPKCGYIDPPEWRRFPWKWDVDFCKTEDFKILHLDLYEKLVAGHEIVFDNNFAYRFSGKAKLVVWRVWIKLWEWGGRSAFSTPMEK